MVQKKLIRIGTCGSLREGINLKDVVIAMASTTDSGMNKDRFGNISFAPTASFELLRNAYDKAKRTECTCSSKQHFYK